MWARQYHTRFRSHCRTRSDNRSRSGISAVRSSYTEARRGGPPRFFSKADVYNLPFEQETFDAVFAHGLFSHLSEPQRALFEIGRVLKRGALVGLRDADWGGALVYPSDWIVDAALERFLLTMKASGGEPEMGRRLGALLKEARFGDVRMSASFEVYDPMLAASYLARFTGDHPIASSLFLAQPWCETIANKI